MPCVVNGQELILSGDVGSTGGWWPDEEPGFTSSDVIVALAQIGNNNPVTVRLNSGGGIVWDGLAIHAALSRHAGFVTMQVEGVAASAASVIAMAGDKIEMALGAVMMVHDPATITIGTVEDHRISTDQLVAVTGSMASIYAKKTGQTIDQCRADMAAETWMTAEEAVGKGYADCVAGSGETTVQPVEPAPFAYRGYRHAPAAIITLADAKRWPKHLPRAVTKVPPIETEKAQMPTEEEIQARIDAAVTKAREDDKVAADAAASVAATEQAASQQAASATANRANAAEIADICNAGNAPTMIGSLIREGVTAATARERVNAAGQIKDVVALARKNAPQLAADFADKAKAPSLLGVTPRILGAPGYTGVVSYAATAPVITHPGNNYTHPVVTFSPAGATATATVGNAGVQATAHATLSGGGIGAIAIDNGGQDYGTVPSVTISGGGGTGATAHAVLNANGQVSSIVVDAPGSGFTSAPTVTIAAPVGGQITAINLTNPGSYPTGTAVTMSIADSNGGAGTGATATVTLEMLANPICAALPAICNALLAHAVVGGPGTTKQAAIDWRGTLNSQRLIPVDNWEIIASGSSDAYMDGAASTMGIGVRVDFLHAGYPFWSWANQPIQGLLGLKRVDGFSLLDGATDAQELLADGVGVTVRGDLSDVALTNAGYQLICYNNASSDTNYNMLNKTRGRDFTNLAIIKSVRQRLGVDNITVHSVQAVLNDMTAIMTDLRGNNCVVGFKVGFSPDTNNPANLRLGNIRVFDNSEEPAPILQVTIDRALDSDALVSELAQIAADTDQVTG